MRVITDVDLKLLQIFKVIVDCGGFSAAQFKLNMHQSTISTKMSQLETRLGLNLCHRGRRGFQLTHDGDLVYQYVEDLLAQIHCFEDKIDQIRTVSQGHIRFAMTDNLATNPKCDIQGALQQFFTMHPAVHLDSHVLDSYQIEMMLLNKKIDIGITSSEIKKDGLQYDFLFNETQCLYCSCHHPILQLKDKIHQDDLYQYQVVDRGLSHPITPINGFPVSANVNTTNMEMTLMLILSTNFIGYLPVHYTQSWVEQGKLVKLPLPELEYHTDFHLTTLASAEHSIASQYLIETILAAHN